MEKLQETVLDDLVSEIAISSLSILDKQLPNISNELRVQYFARSFAEILAVIITSAPAIDALVINESICEFLKSAVSQNINIESIMKSIPSEKTLNKNLHDTFFVNKKASA